MLDSSAATPVTWEMSQPCETAINKQVPLSIVAGYFRACYRPSKSLAIHQGEKICPGSERSQGTGKKQGIDDESHARLLDRIKSQQDDEHPVKFYSYSLAVQLDLLLNMMRICTPYIDNPMRGILEG